jgi:hypothetical protein
MKRLVKFAAVSGLFLLASMFISVTASAAPGPAPAGPVFHDGFESGNLSAWSKSKGLVVESTFKHTGTFGAQGNTTAGTTYAEKTLPATYAEGYAVVWFDLVSASSQVALLRLRTAAGAPIATVGVSKSGRLELTPAPGSTGKRTVLSSRVVTLGVWHSLELHVHVAGAASLTQVWLDGTPVGGLATTLNLGSVPIGMTQIGDTQKGRTYDVVFDDAAFSLTKLI